MILSVSHRSGRAALCTRGWLVLAVLGALSLPAAQGAEPRGPLDPLLYRDLLGWPVMKARQLEFFEMLSAITDLPNMGPGDGWFHPSKSRYDWKWLLKRYDRNGDGKIEASEFTGPRDLFARLDRDGDGVLRADDFDWTEKAPFVRQMGMARSWVGRIGNGQSGRITKEEWDEFFRKASAGKGHLTADDLYRALMKPPKREGPPGPEPSPFVFLNGFLTGELGSFFEGPGIGDRAPNFTLKTHDGKRTVSLKDYRGKKPVVLVFGSFT